MHGDRATEMKVLVGALLIGGLLFLGMLIFGDTIPVEYRNTSPGFGWSWDFDYEAAMRQAGRPGAEPWPWPAKATGRRLVLPIDQPLDFRGLEMTYRGMPESGSFRLDVVIQSLDAGVTYRKNFRIQEAERGFTISDRRFALEHITSRYLRLGLISS